MVSPASVIGWSELGLVINSSTDVSSGTFRFYPQFPNPVITITSQPQDANVMAGSISGNLAVAATVSPGGTPAYQWYSNATESNIGGTLITDATDATFTIPTDLTAGTYYYYCVVSAADADSLTSRIAVVTVNPASPTSEYVSFSYGTETATGIVSGKRLSVEALLDTPVGLPQTMLVALYNKSGRLIGMANGEGVISDNKVKFNVDFDIPISIDSEAYVKVLVWNSQTYAPIRDDLIFSAMS
jgi:hypothetical protein